jgi:sarcosine oxidase subunit delta
MLNIPCPFCGPRAELEFSCAGEPVGRPDPAAAADGAALAEILYLRDNAKGVHVELWWHRLGCRRWFRLGRDTRDNGILP